MKAISCICVAALAAISAYVSASSPAVENEIGAVVGGLSTPYQFSNRPAKTHTLKERMDHYKVPGVSIAYFRGGKILWARGFGTLEIGGTRPVTADTVFQAASISKPVAAMTALSLVEDGSLALDGSIGQWLGAWQIPANPYTDKQGPTLRQLLSHSAGIGSVVTAGYGKDESLPNMMQMLNGVPPAKNKLITIDYAPGSKYEYSVGTYLILQHIIESVTGRSFADVARQRVLAPNKMTASGFYPAGLPADISESSYARGHTGEGNIINGGYKIYPELAAAGLWTTPSDLAKLAIDVQQSLKRRSNHVLSADMTQKMLTRQIGIWGLGWEFVSQEDPAPSFYHTGSNLGYKSALYARRDGSEGVAIMTNGENGNDIFFEILTGMAMIYDWDELKPKVRAVFAMTHERLAAFEGEYAFSEPIKGVMIVKSYKETITIEIPGLAAAKEFYPDSATSFFDLGGNALRFELDESQVPIRLIVGDLVGARTTRPRSRIR